MPGSSTAPGHPGARGSAPRRIAFRAFDHVGTREFTNFAALDGWPMRSPADALADASARLGADVGRYSFIATDLHRLLLAGLPAHQPTVEMPPGRMHSYVAVMLFSILAMLAGAASYRWVYGYLGA